MARSGAGQEQPPGNDPVAVHGQTPNAHRRSLRADGGEEPAQVRRAAKGAAVAHRAATMVPDASGTPSIGAPISLKAPAATREKTGAATWPPK